MLKTCCIFIFVAFVSITVLAPYCMGQDRIELGYQTTKRGVVWYRNGLPKHNPNWRLSRDTNAVIWCDTFSTLRYWWSYKDDKWITDGVLTSALPPLPTLSSGLTTIDNRQATWIPANNIRHRFDLNQTAWVPIGDWFYLATAPSNVASGGSNGAAVYTTSLWQDSDDQIVRYWDGDSWEPFGGTSYTDEQAQDAVFSAIAAGAGISVSYNDAGNLFTITNTGDLSTTNEIQTLSGSGSGPFAINLSLSGGSVGLVEGTGIDITRSGNDFTINATGSGGNGIYGGDGSLPTGGTDVTTNGYPLNFITNTSLGTVRPTIQIHTPYSSDDAFTEYLSCYTPIDSFKIFNFDGATYVKSFSGNLNLESDETALITADSVQVSTVANNTKVPALVGINAQGTLKQITATTNDHVLKWSSGGWVTGAVPGGGGGITGTGTNNYVAYWTGASTLGADADFQFDGTRVGIQGAPVSGFSLYTANAVRFDGTAVIRGSGSNFTGSTATPHFRLWNTVGDTWYIGSEDDGELSVTSSNLGGIMAKFTANGDYQLTNALEMKVDAAPPTAPADGLSIYTEERALQFPAWVDESGRTWEVAPSEVGSKWAKLTANGNGTTVGVWGLTSNASGTATTRNIATTNAFTSTRRIGYVTGTTANTPAGNRYNVAQFFRGDADNKGGFYFAAKFGFSTADAANKASFVGMSSTTGALGGSTTPSNLTNIVAFGHDAGQTTLRFLYNDGSGTATPVNLGANFPTNTTDTDMYDARIYAPANSSNVYYWIKNITSGNVASGVVNSNLPAQTQLLAPHIWVSNGASAVSVGIDIVQYEVITNY